MGTVSNKRIDLTQFEGHTKGEWCIYDGSLIVRTDETSVLLAEPYWDDGITEDECIINKKLMISGPDLIAELKRCYEEIDDLKRQYQSCNEALRDTTDWVVRMVDAIDSGKMSEIKRVRNS